MALSKEIRLLMNKWGTNSGWPKRLESLEIRGLRGWTGQRIDFRFPILAICGENGSGKSTVLQCAAAAYAPPSVGDGYFASDFFPDTIWEEIRQAEIRATIREGIQSTTSTIRKPSTRWRGNPDRRKRDVVYVDLSRVQPVSARVGYSKIAKPTVSEIDSSPFDDTRRGRLSAIMGREYANAKMVTTSAGAQRVVPVISIAGDTLAGVNNVSGFHMGAGETTIAEFLKIDPAKYALVLIDEIETSLHPRAQRRLLRDLADLCRVRELQLIISTHSPYILSELPPEARAYILPNRTYKEVVLGVSPDFAMTQMDEEQHPECDLYVEDLEASILLREILVVHAADRVQRAQIIPFGAASVGQALGHMVSQRRFPRPSLVFLDGDQSQAAGCILLPGTDAPERIVFAALQAKNWAGLHTRIGRNYADTADACVLAMTLGDHHEWLRHAASSLLLSGTVLWQAMCAEWVKECVDQRMVAGIVDSVTGILP